MLNDKYICPKDDSEASGCVFYDLNRDNIPCLRSIPDITLTNPPGTAVLIKMMLFDPEVGQKGECGRKAGKGKRD
jgi:hypothetical protein